MKVFTFALSLSCYLLASSQALAAPAKVYKWTDEKGLVHYSERPPFGKQTEIVKPETGHSEPVDYGTASSEKSKEESKVANAKSSLKDPERCDTARKNLDTLKSYTRIKVKDDNGEYRFLTPDEKQQNTNEAAKAIAESCE
jgi:hypothetical protein